MADPVTLSKNGGRMNKRFYLLLPVAFLFLLAGCANTGMYIAQNVTMVELSEPNYQIVATNISGESQAAYLLGFSYSLGAVTESVALIKIAGSGMLYQEALENLWQNFQKTNGTVVGRKLALINMRYDADTANWLLYTKAQLSIRADVIEFGE
jgi:hypothetical protein